MTRLVIGAAALILVLGAVVACEGDTQSEDRCISASYLGKIDEQGKLHGGSCTADADCKYGYCYKDSSINGAQFGICTKNCGCGDETTTCAYDDPADGSFHYVCYRPSIHSGADTLGSYCVPACASNGDATSIADWCAAHDPAYDTCETPFGTTPVCTTGGN